MTKRQFSLVLAGLALALVIFGGSLGRRHLYDSDEARFALLAQDILTRGDWLLPRLRGEPYMNRPPLFIWLIVLVSLPGRRVTEFTAQLPAALGAAGAVMGTALIGARLWGRRVGFAAALILGTSVGYVHHAGFGVNGYGSRLLYDSCSLLLLYRHPPRKRPRISRVRTCRPGRPEQGASGIPGHCPGGAAAFDRHGWRGWRPFRRSSVSEF